MESITTIYKIGFGPSSSHTMGPGRAADKFKALTPEATSYKVSLFGSLGATGKGHLTDKAISEQLAPKEVTYIWCPEITKPEHPNALTFDAINNKGEIYLSKTYFSTGGGTITEHPGIKNHASIYPLHTMEEILGWCQKTGKNIWEYVADQEDDTLWDYLDEVWTVMQQAVQNGLDHESRLPGPLNISRKASSYYTKAFTHSEATKPRVQLYAYALAVAEENASGGKVVTAPTCGSCGVLPAVLRLLHEYQQFNHKKILHALATAGLIGNLIRYNASISGAEVGCQGEIGTACAMAAAAATQLFGGSPAQVEYAAEMGLEHHLGLTCDPVLGLVQIPCIERNAFAAARALDSKDYALLSDGQHRVSFDRVVEVMKETGHDIPALYRETALGGLAKRKPF